MRGGVADLSQPETGADQDQHAACAGQIRVAGRRPDRGGHEAQGRQPDADKQKVRAGKLLPLGGIAGDMGISRSMMAERPAM
ncbi:hypothetical protein MASR1M32_36010 [Rhodobacter sp.]